MKVKICGITNTEDALLASSLGADALGFIFSQRSPRCISKKSAQKIINALDPFLIKVGVFLNQKKEEVTEIASFLKLDVLQFHGEESSSYCRFFKSKFKVFKVFFPKGSASGFNLSSKRFFPDISNYKVDAFLFDIRYQDKQHGKKRLSAQALKEIAVFIKQGKRVIISGGLNPDNILSIKKINPYAVDVASGVERFIGRKDQTLLTSFINKAK